MRDNDIYTSEMVKSIGDKAFFINKIPGAKCVVDFGCADGSLIWMLAPKFPDIVFYGYDCDESMINRARLPFDYGDALPNVMFSTPEEYDIMISNIKAFFAPDEICVNFSSVLHEVFSFNEGASIQKLINDLNPKYITIRDMYFYTDDTSKFSANVSSISKQYILEFEKAYGPINSWKQFTHFLMKYQWINNGWEEELKEDYYSWNINSVLTIFRDKYDIIFENHYQLPYLTDMWKNKFNIYHPAANTHAQFILKRN